MASKMMDPWGQVTSKALETIFTWLKAMDKSSSISHVTKVVKTVTVVRDHAITEAATLPPTLCSTLPTKTQAFTHTMTSTMTSTTPITTSSPILESAGITSSSSTFPTLLPSFPSWMPTINWSLLNLLFLLLFVATCAKSLYNHRRHVTAIGKQLLGLLNSPGPITGAHGMFVIGDVDFHIHEDMTTRMSRTARRAWVKAQRTAGRIGRLPPVIPQQARFWAVEIIHHPIFGYIIGFTVCFVVFVLPTVRKQAAFDVAEDGTWGLSEAQIKEQRRIRSPWTYGPPEQPLALAFVVGLMRLMQFLGLELADLVHSLGDADTSYTQMLGTGLMSLIQFLGLGITDFVYSWSLCVVLAGLVQSLGLGITSLGHSIGAAFTSLGYSLGAAFTSLVHLLGVGVTGLTRLLTTAFTSIMTHWLLASTFSLLVGVLVAAIGIANWRDNLPLERRQKVDRKFDEVRIWFLTIDWPKHGGRLLGLGVKIRDLCIFLAPVVLEDLPWVLYGMWIVLLFVCSWAWWLPASFVKLIATFGFKILRNFVDWLESRKLAKAQKELEDLRASQKTAKEETTKKHSTELTELGNKLPAKEQEIFGLKKTNELLNKDLEMEKHFHSKSNRSYKLQLDGAVEIREDVETAGWSQARYSGFQSTILRQTNVEQGKQHKEVLEKVEGERDQALEQLTSLKGSVETKIKQIRSKDTETITRLEGTERSLNDALKAKDKEINAIKTEGNRIIRDEQERTRSAGVSLENKKAPHESLKKSHEELQGKYNASLSQSQALRGELNKIKSSLGASQTNDDGVHAERSAASAKHEGFLAHTTYQAQFPNGVTASGRALDRKTMGLEAQDLQNICNDPELKAKIDELRDPANNLEHSTGQLERIARYLSERQRNPLTVGIMTTEKGILSRYRIGDGPDRPVRPKVVWIAQRLPADPKEGEKPSTPGLIELYGLKAKNAAPEQNRGNAVAGPSNDKPTGNGNPSDGKDAADQQGPKGQQGPQDGKPSGTNSAPTSKDAGASKAISKAISKAEQEFKSRFPDGFTILNDDDDDDDDDESKPKRITGLSAIIETMTAMAKEAEYQNLHVPTYDDLRTICESHSTVLKQFTGGEFGPENLNADGIHYILDKLAEENFLNLQLGTMRRGAFDPSDHGSFDTIDDLKITSNPTVDGSNCITIWIYNDNGRSEAGPITDIYSDWAGLKPRVSNDKGKGVPDLTKLYPEEEMFEISGQCATMAGYGNGNGVSVAMQEDADYDAGGLATLLQRNRYLLVGV
ncbi:MAG: hypothetical protein Q9226_004868 [Calogaya cf. arnoldii]